MWSMLAVPQKSRPVVRVGALSTRVLFGTPLAQLKHYNLRPEVRGLHEFIAVNRDEIISRWSAKVSARSTPPPTEAEIDHGVPVFLDQLTHALRLGLIRNPEISRSAVEHGHDLLRRGFSLCLLYTSPSPRDS